MWNFLFLKVYASENVSATLVRTDEKNVAEVDLDIFRRYHKFATRTLTYSFSFSNFSDLLGPSITWIGFEWCLHQCQR